MRGEQAGPRTAPILAITAVVGPERTPLLDLQRAGHPTALSSSATSRGVPAAALRIGGERLQTLTAAMQPADGVQRAESPIGLEFGA